MALKDSYSRSRATKKNVSINLNGNISKKSHQKVSKTIKKSPILAIALLFLLIGVAGGFFAYKTFSGFDMNSYKINGVVSAETDYVVVDLSEIKKCYLENNPNAEMDEIFASIKLEDELVTCNFFGMDKSNTVSVKYYYREDISHNTQEVSKVDVTTAGVYYIEYTSSFFAFKNTTLIRTIIVTGVENDG